LAHHLSDVKSRADLETLGRRLARGGRLHGDGAAHGIRRGGEGHHEPVAQPLELTPAVGRDRVREELVVRLEEFLGPLVPPARSAANLILAGPLA
jgi:hypothetical protein